MNSMSSQAPLTITDEILKYASKVSPKGKPTFIPVTPVAGAGLNECFSNVESHIKSHGGSLQLGWYIYLWPRIWIEFVFHAVWLQTTDNLVDLTPHPDNEKEILFLPAPNIQSYTGLSPDNVRFPLSKSPLVTRLIELGEERFYALNKDKTPYAKKWKVNFAEMNRIKIEMEHIITSLNWKPERNDACPCGSRKKFKYCCSQ